MPDVTRDTHYVPQATLRRWSDDGSHVDAYRLLVSHPNVPEWELRAIKNVAFQSDLYTTRTGGPEAEEDAFDRFVTKDFEEPGQIAIERLITTGRLTSLAWRDVARFVAAQDLRTPLSFLEVTNRLKTQIPDALEETIARLETARADGVKPVPERAPTPLDEVMRIRIEAAEEGSGQAIVRTELSSARSVWMATTRQLLVNRADVIWKHRWSLVTPDGDEEWPLSDHPVMRLHYHSADKYDFEGGWGNPGTELIMPISPKLLLYTHIGKRNAKRLSFSAEQTRVMQRLLVERAFRWVFARRRMSWVSAFRPREVNPEMFAAEQEAWQRWHPDQAEAEEKFKST